ncbi:hypothetical protein ACLKA7_003400 [Drosophila subpalustris]
MLCSGKLGLSLLLLIWCTFESTASSTEQRNDDDADILEALLSGAPQELDNKTNVPNVDLPAKKDEQSNDEDVDILEALISSGPKELDNTKNGQKFDLSAKRDEFETKLVNILAPRGPQTDLLKATLDETFKNISYRLENNQNAKSCGDNMECVEIWMCKNSTRNQNGMYSIQFRTSFVEGECNYNQICCHTSDKIEKRPKPEVLSRMQDCGIRHVNGVELAIEGERNLEANFGEFPWMIGILEKETSLVLSLLINYGGGSLLAPNVVLTAAHKVANKLPSNLIARAGEWDSATTKEIYNHQDLGVQRIIVHAQFHSTYNNIALLLLKGSFNPSPHISPICLPSFNENFDYSRCIVTGWGKRASTSKEYPHILKEITVPVLPRSECNNKLKLKLGPGFLLEQGSICAGGEKDVDSCFGDGGAPLICPIKNSPNRYYQAGIVAWGIGCGMENVPAVYTNVPYFSSWISEELSKLHVDNKYYTV